MEQLAIFRGEQKSPEWFALRKGKITGSIASAILGRNPYKSRKAVLRDFVRDLMNLPSQFQGNAATRRGEAQEPLAREWYARKYGCVVEQVGGIGEGDYFVSPDGLVGFRGSIEIKAPDTAGYRSLDDAPYYRDQIQLLLNISGRAWCDFIIWRGPSDVVVERVVRDMDWMDRNRVAFETFLADVKRIMADPDLLEELLPKDDRTDGEWEQAVTTYRAARLFSEQAERDLAKAKDRLQELAPTGGKGFGLSLAKVERAGNIAYATVVKKLLPDVDLEPYRGKPSLYFRVDDTDTAE